MKTGRTISAKAGVQADGPAVRPSLGFGFLVGATVLLAACGCSKKGPAPPPSESIPSVYLRALEVSEGPGKEPVPKTKIPDSRWTPAPRSFDQRETVVELLSAGDMKAALPLVYGEPPGSRREELLGRFAFTLAKSLPAEAAAIVDKDMVAGTERDEAAIAVVHQWALNDLMGAQNWAKTFPEGPLKARAFREIAGVTDYVEATLRQGADR